MNKEKTFGISHHDLFTGEPIDINELVLKVAQETGAPQGSIVEAAPPFVCKNGHEKRHNKYLQLISMH